MLDYLRDPDAIYAQSFATIRAEADLAHLPLALHPVAMRMIHTCGMVDLAADIVGDARVTEAVEHALGKGGDVLCDSAMVAAGIHSRVAAERLATINHPTVPDLAARLGTTRSAAAVGPVYCTLSCWAAPPGNPIAFTPLVSALALPLPLGNIESRRVIATDVFQLLASTVPAELFRPNRKRGGSMAST